MKYFELFDDMYIPKRWHLGEVTFADGDEPLLIDGERLDRGDELFAPVTDPGTGLAFSLTSFAVPVASGLLAHAIAAVAGGDVQLLPVTIEGCSDMFVLNSTRRIECLDEGRSVFVKWTEHDHRSDLAGEYRQVTKLVLNLAAIPPDAHFFRVSRWPVALIVSQTMKTAMELTGCHGAKFFDRNPAD